MNRDIPALTGLRAIAAAWVLVFHVVHALEPVGGHVLLIGRLVGGAGYLGVDIFFVLSGFVLAHNYAAEARCSSASWYVRFLWKRLARIYPVHVAALLLFLTYVTACVAFDLSYNGIGRLTLESFLRTITLTQAWSMPVASPWNVVSWSVSAEFAAYIAFPVVAVIAARLNSIRSVVTAVIISLLALGYLISHGEWPKTMAYGLIRIAFEFPIGILLHRVWTLRNYERGGACDLFAILALVSLILGANAIDLLHGESTSLPYMPAIAAAVVYFFACSDGLVHRVTSNSLIQAAGRVSFSFYMVHGVFIGLASVILATYDWNTSPGIALTTLFSAVIASGICAWWFYCSIEEPARRAMILLAGHHRSSKGVFA